ncbi:MAG: hypothetical protein HOJ00_02560 [Phycisphaerae bacterium]|jgi:hypothetical protein|nr:hypothetical protein [Phycisphaerae bacterium]
MIHQITSKSAFLLMAIGLASCGESQKTSKPLATTETKLAAIKTLNAIIKPSTSATVITSNDIDWPVGDLPWDRFTLPLISPNGLHAIVQLGKTPGLDILCGLENTPVTTTSVELYALDPLQGRRISPLVVDRKGLVIGRGANDQFALVELPAGENGRWIGEIDWATGSLRWIVSDDAINCFSTTNPAGDIAWSRREQDDNRFHLVVKTSRGQRVIDDGSSDWLLPSFVGNGRLRAFQILNGRLTLVEFDLRATDSMQTSIALPIIQSGATREIAWQIATTNSGTTVNSPTAFYHPVRKRMVVWQPNNVVDTVALEPNSIAAVPVADGSWLVSTTTRVIRQSNTGENGIHLRNRFAIPIATTSLQWTHLFLIPDGNRLQIRAINIGE